MIRQALRRLRCWWSGHTWFYSAKPGELGRVCILCGKKQMKGVIDRGHE